MLKWHLMAIQAGRKFFGVKSMPAHLTRHPPPPSFALARGNAFSPSKL